MQPLIAEQRLALMALEYYTRLIFAKTNNEIAKILKKEDPDGDWDDLWASEDIEKFRSHFNRHAKRRWGKKLE